MNIAEDKLKGKTESFNPATGEYIGSSKLHSIEDLQKVIKEARVAQVEWAKLPVNERVKYVIKIRDYFVENIDRVSEIISNENGKVRIDALVTEVMAAAMSITYYCKNANRFLKDKKLRSGNIFLSYKRSLLTRVPVGVIGIIAPWNYPITIPIHDIIVGLLSGNGVIFKAATETQLVGLEIERALKSAGLPDGLFNFINIPGRMIADAFIEYGIDKIFFTGSVEIGKTIAEKASKKLIPVSLELGGNDAMLVCEDADLIRTVNGAMWGGFTNTGQSCGGIERVYVHQKIYTSFVELLEEKTKELRVGIDVGFNSDIGCMTTQAQVNIINEHIDDALAKGAKLLVQSKVLSSAERNTFIPAKILVDVNHDMLVMNEESFGPLLGVMKVSDMDEALNLANDSQYGLTGSVWSKNTKEAIEIARKINAGSIMINDHLVSHGMAETPWGGFKDSGRGRSHGSFSFNEMTEPKVIIRDLLPGIKKNLWWYPFDKSIYSGLKGILLMMYSKKFSERVAGLKNLIKIFPRIFKK